LEQGSTAQEACKKAMDYVLEKTGGRGGIIMIDQKGEIGYFFNTSTMAWATASGKGVKHGKILRKTISMARKADYIRKRKKSRKEEILFFNLT